MTLLSIKTLRNTVLSLCVALGPTLSFAASTEKTDNEVKEEVSKFSDENSKIREEHISTMRDLHVKHVNEMYDRKIKQHREIDELRKQMKVGDKEGNKAIKKQIEAKREAFKAEQKKFQEDFKENVLNQKNKEFRGHMKTRYKEMKGKHKN